MFSVRLGNHRAEWEVGGRSRRGNWERCGGTGSLFERRKPSCHPGQVIPCSGTTNPPAPLTLLGWAKSAAGGL